MKHSIAHIIFQNTFYNFLTQLLLIVIALWSLPIVVKGLSNEGFGLLALFWAFIGYFTLLDFGIGRANVKFLSEAIATGDSVEIKKIVWTSLSVSLAMGTVSGAAIVLATPVLVNNFFNIDPALVAEANHAFIFAGIGVPFMLIFGSLKGFQMALQRFKIFNIFQAVTGVVQWIGSVILLWWGFGFFEIVVLTVGLRVILCLIAFVVLNRLIPGIFSALYLWDRPTLKKLLTFGGWVTVSQLVSPLFLYIDRIFIGIFLPLSAVAYYTVPQETLTRLLVVPMSLTTTLFPALSMQANVPGKEQQSALLYSRSLKYVAIVMLPVTLGFILFAPEILRLWIGEEYATHCAVIFQILSVGLFFNSLAQIPTTALHAYGRPDITAKFHLMELPLMIILNLILIPLVGIIGAAVAWTLRVAVDAFLLFIGAQRSGVHTGWSGEALRPKLYFLVRQVTVIVLVAAVMIFTENMLKIVLAAVLAIGYCITIWSYGFDETDRNFFLRLAKMLTDKPVDNNAPAK